MFFTQVLYRDLGCASYVLGDGGEAVIVDPRWDIRPYLEIARAERLTIRHVVDTHDHADHLSGRKRLAAETGAHAWRPAAPTDRAGANPGGGELGAGTELTVGAVRMRAIATPGHRPEHLAFAVSDLKRGPSPWLVLTGDSLLVGDVARPDLAVDAGTGAQLLHASLRELVALGDHVEVWPAHVGGSLCGGSSLSRRTSSTVGFERLHNPLLAMDEQAFTSRLTAALPSRPPNVERIVALNQDVRGRLPSDPPRLDVDRLLDLLQRQTVVLDSRSPEAFDAGHLAGAINLPAASAGVGTRAGWALDPDRPLVVVAESDTSASDMTLALQAVGFWAIAGWVPADPFAWRSTGLPVVRADAWDLDHLAANLRSGTVDLVDVREASEWVDGHVSGSLHVPLHRMRDLGSLRLTTGGRPTAVACAGGGRAAFAASLLRRAGHEHVVRVAGGGVPDLGQRGIQLAVGLD